MRKVTTRQDLKDILKQNKKKLAENCRLVQHFNARLLDELDKHKGKEVKEVLASLEEVRKGLIVEIEGITNLLSLNVIDITIEEEE